MEAVFNYLLQFEHLNQQQMTTTNTISVADTVKGLKPNSNVIKIPYLLLKAAKLTFYILDFQVDKFSHPKSTAINKT
ncbi:hypothetical protein ACVWYG_003650 [Pedobacter sp. UYEF25]